MELDQELKTYYFAFNQNNVQFSAHIIIEKENDFYIAHALEFDITTDGKTLEETQQNIIECIQEHISFCIEKGNFDKILDPAPQEFWNKLLYSRHLCNIPFPDNGIPDNINNPIKSFDIYEVSHRA